MYPVFLSLGNRLGSWSLRDRQAKKQKSWDKRSGHLGSHWSCSLPWTLAGMVGFWAESNDLIAILWMKHSQHHLPRKTSSWSKQSVHCFRFTDGKTLTGLPDLPLGCLNGTRVIQFMCKALSTPCRRGAVHHSLTDVPRHLKVTVTQLLAGQSLSNQADHCTVLSSILPGSLLLLPLHFLCNKSCFNSKHLHYFPYFILFGEE